MADRAFRVGDSVLVKAGVRDPDTGTAMTGWQGRITAVHPGPTTQVEIRWDSITLQNMPHALITDCEAQGLDWTAMVLDANEVLGTPARDGQAEVARAQTLLAQQVGWLGLGGAQGKRIQQVVNSAASPNEGDVMEAWHTHLQAHLRFPFPARVSEAMRGPVRQGDTLQVLAITMLDDSYGTIVAVQHTQGLLALPLCDLAVTDPTAAHHALVADYSVWFANR